LLSKILIIQPAFIGDVILATGVIEKLHQYHPDAKIDFFLRKGNEGLLKNNPAIHQVLVWDKKKNKNKNLLALLKQIRKEKYDLVINLQRFFSSGFITAFSNARYTVGYDKNPLSYLFSKRVKHEIASNGVGKHEVERNHLLIQKWTDTDFAKPKLYPSSEDFDSVKEFKGAKYITAAPTSVWFTKQYPKEKWIEFLSQVPADMKVYLLGAPGDKLVCDEIAEASNNKNIINLAGKLSFLQSAALMKDAVMNYVNDSAPMHIASSMDAPVCAIFCSTIPSFGFGPLSSNSTVVEIRENLYCRPCGLHGYKKCPEGHFKCGYSIHTKELLQLIP